MAIGVYIFVSIFEDQKYRHNLVNADNPVVDQTKLLGRALELPQRLCKRGCDPLWNPIFNKIGIRNDRSSTATSSGKSSRGPRNALINLACLQKTG